ADLSLRPFPVSTRSCRTRPALALARPACLVNRIRAGTASYGRIRIQNHAAVDPDLDPDHAKSRMRFRETIVHIRAQSVQWQLALQMPLAAGNLSAVEPAADLYLDSLCSEA